ncbi:MAG TPA: HlyD family efflux transporter periplasmic adaptor subunit [Gammaproteobacteria bacterium]|nr:HlyD family efflux transporter periplasmic adaptor subunit [Gammaproteobacteria bacterium]
MQFKRKTGITLILLAVMGALAWGFWPGPVPVESAPVVRAPLRVTVEEEGRTRVKDRFIISAPVAGYLQRILLDVGDAVTRGQTLAVMEPLRPEVLDPRSRARAEAQVAAAQAALKSAEEQVISTRAEATYAEAEYRRKQKLLKDALISQGDLDQAQTLARQATAARRSAEFAVQVARFDLEAAQTALQYSVADGDGEDTQDTVKLRAPVTSRVLAIHHESEGVVVTGEDLLEIGDPAALEVAVDVLSADAVRIRPGGAVQFQRWGGEQPLDGVVRVVEPTGFTKISALGVEEQRVWVIADITSSREQWQQLGDGYRVEAHFILWEAQDVLQVPASALFRHGDGWAVFAIRDGRARRVAVEAGHSNGLVTEVLAGIEPGETVIVHPDDRIEDGVRVTRQ